MTKEQWELLERLALLTDKEGPTKIEFTVTRFCEEPNRGLIAVQAHGREGTSIVPYVAVDGPPMKRI